VKEIKNLTHRVSKSNTNVIVCPVCLQNSLSILPNTFLGILAPRTYICHNCEYQGPIFAEMEIEEYERMKNMSISDL